MSFRRFAASARKRERMPSASLTMSAGSESGRSGCGGVVASLDVPSAEDEASPVLFMERLRVWPMRVVRPVVRVVAGAEARAPS